MGNKPSNDQRGNNKGPLNNGPRNRQSILVFLLCLMVTLVGVSLFTNMFKGDTEEVTYSEFLAMLEDDEVKEVVIQSGTITITPKKQPDKYREIKYYTHALESGDALVERLEACEDVKYELKVPDPATELLSNLVTLMLPTLVLFGLLMLFMRKMGKGGMMGVGKSKAKAYVQKETGVTFQDVAGQDEAKESLQEVVEFLQDRKSVV